MHISNVCVTDQPTDKQTDMTSYRSARTHLKRRKANQANFINKSLHVGLTILFSSSAAFSLFIVAVAIFFPLVQLAAIFTGFHAIPEASFFFARDAAFVALFLRLQIPAALATISLLAEARLLRLRRGRFT